MAKQLQIRGGTTAQHSTFTGALREITVDTDKDVIVVHDGTTVGGFPLAKQTSVDSKVAKVTSTDNAVVRFDGTTGAVQNSGVTIDDSGNLLLTSAAGGLGYGAGAGGTVTQLTSKSTDVTLNKPSGRITMHNASLAAGASAQFVLYNSLITPTDMVYCQALTNASIYRVEVFLVFAGGCSISVKNEAIVSLAVAVPLAFCIIKGAIS